MYDKPLIEVSISAQCFGADAFGGKVNRFVCKFGLRKLDEIIRAQI